MIQQNIVLKHSSDSETFFLNLETVRCSTNDYLIGKTPEKFYSIPKNSLLFPHTFRLKYLFNTR